MIGWIDARRLRRARAALLRPGQFLVRAARASGPERDAVVQAAKAGLAAAAAWLVARWLVHSPQAFLAPYIAVFLVVEVTVYRSVRDAGQQLAVVVTGVVLAVAALGVLEPVSVALAVVTLVGLLVGRLRLFGGNGAWVAITAVIVVAEGPEVSTGSALARVVETALGAVIGVGVNVVLFPPVYQRDAWRAVSSSAGRVADLLGDMAGGIRESWDSDRAHEWLHRARSLVDQARRARETVTWARESLRLNPLRRPASSGSGVDALTPAADAVVEVATHVRGLAEAAVEAMEEIEATSSESDAADGDDPPSPEPAFVQSFGDLLAHLAAGVGEIRDDPAALSPWTERDPPGVDAFDLMSGVHRDAARRLPRASGSVRTGWAAEGALISAAQRAVTDLTGRQPPGHPRDDG